MYNENVFAPVVYTYFNLFSVVLPLPKPTRLRPVDEKPLQKSEDKGKVYLKGSLRNWNYVYYYFEKKVTTNVAFIVHSSDSQLGYPSNLRGCIKFQIYSNLKGYVWDTQIPKA